jgi:phosphatidylinositol glycan class V
MLYCSSGHWLAASLAFMLAALFRSNAILLSGFIIWGLVIKPNRPSIMYALFLSALVCTPFLLHHIAAYLAFCTTTTPAIWCQNTPPSIYTHVQSFYWNVGFLRYWTPQQIPNFLISAPPLVLLFYFSIYHIAHNPLRHPLTPHAIHALVLCSTLLFSSHTQIILRLNPSMPIVYWAAASLLLDHPFWGRLWVIWSVVWGAISIVLWATFLPPA